MAMKVIDSVFPHFVAFFMFSKLELASSSDSDDLDFCSEQQEALDALRSDTSDDEDGLNAGDTNVSSKPKEAVDISGIWNDMNDRSSAVSSSKSISEYYRKTLENENTEVTSKKPMEFAGVRIDPETLKQQPVEKTKGGSKDRPKLFLEVRLARVYQS